MSIYAKTAAGWVEVAGGSGGGAALSSWGRVVGEPTGAVTSTYYKNDDGSQWQYWEFNTEGTYEIDLGNGGLFWVLAVGGGDSGGGDSSQHYQHGQPGLMREGYWEFGPGTHPVTVGARGGNNNQVFGKPSFIDDILTGFSTQGTSTWGDTSTGRGVEAAGGTGYRSRITGDELEYATGYVGEDRPGRSGYISEEQRDGCVIIATRIDVEQLAPAPAELAPAPVMGAPVKVSGTADVIEYVVRQTDGTRKKIYMLAGNTAGGDENVFEVALGAGVLPGVMVGSGGPGGYCAPAGVFSAVGGGGSGGVIGQGAHVPVILPVQGTATYTVKVGGTSTFTNENDIYLYGQNTTIEVQGQEPFIAAIGGGSGLSYRGGQYVQPHQGASGGGGSIGSAEGSVNAYWAGAKGIPGQGNDGGMAVYAWCGGGGGYSAPGEGSQPPYNSANRNGGAGFDLAAALNLDSNDGSTATFLAAVSANGRIAGGGSAGGGQSLSIDGGGLDGGDAKDYTGAGGGGGSSYGGKGGCGVVYIITDAS